MKIAGEKDNYLKIIDSVIVGPELVRNVKILLLPWYYSDETQGGQIIYI